MGRIAKLLAFIRTSRNGAKVSDVNTDVGGGDNISAENFQPAGDDAHPLTSDYVGVVPVARTGGTIALGYLDPINAPKANEGDKRIYARDPSDGSVVVDVWLKNDGTAVTTNDSGSSTLNPDGSIKGQNANGSFELQAGGDFVVNGVVIDVDGNITSPATVTAAAVAAPSISANSKELAGHLHPAGTPPGNTGANL